MENRSLIEKAIKYFARLPGLGPRSAKRIVLHFLKKRQTSGIIEILKELEENIQECNVCYNIATNEKCEICSNDNRIQKILCVVAEPEDIWNFERGEMFKGRYHCLGGNLSAAHSITPDKLNIQSLLTRLLEEDIEEVIFANNLSIEGATTTFYIIEEISALQQEGKIDKSLKITELANGIPIGGALEYMDGGTIKAAFSSRKAI